MFPDSDPTVTDCLDALVSYEEIAEMLGVKKATVWRWRSTGVIPEPDGTISGQPLWQRERVIAWAFETNRQISM